MAGPTILVLAPTRELAMQIEVECEKFTQGLNIRSVCCYGGAPKGQQLSKMRMGCGVVIGTPGRATREAGRSSSRCAAAHGAATAPSPRPPRLPPHRPAHRRGPPSPPPPR